jgi:hypothetical protein
MKEKEEDYVITYHREKPEFLIRISIERLDIGCKLKALKKAYSILEGFIFKEEEIARKQLAVEEFRKICPGFDENNCTYAQAMQFNAFLKKNGYE